MPQIVAIAFVGAGLYAGFRWVSRVAAEAAERVRQGEAEIRQRAAKAAAPKDLGRLELDPSSGEYRPVRSN